MIEQKDIQQINALLIDHGLGEVTVSELRNKWPNIHFTYCSDDDICGPESICQSEGFSMYLIDSSDHCLRFTSNAELATGLVLAEHEQDPY